VFRPVEIALRFPCLEAPSKPTVSDKRCPQGQRQHAAPRCRDYRVQLHAGDSWSRQGTSSGSPSPPPGRRPPHDPVEIISGGVEQFGLTRRPFAAVAAAFRQPSRQRPCGQFQASTSEQNTNHARVNWKLSKYSHISPLRPCRKGVGPMRSSIACRRDVARQSAMTIRLDPSSSAKSASIVINAGGSRPTAPPTNVTMRRSKRTAPAATAEHRNGPDHGGGGGQRDLVKGASSRRPGCKICRIWRARTCHGRWMMRIFCSRRLTFLDRAGGRIEPVRLLKRSPAG